MASKRCAKVRSLCVACGTCVRSCPRSAISIWKGLVAKINTDKCVGCGICASDCPAGAIDIVNREMYHVSEKTVSEKRDIMISDKFELRNIGLDETDQAIEIETICFPPNEACSPKNMKDRISVAADYFLVAVDKSTGKIAGFLNGVCSDDEKFKDEFFTNANEHDPSGKNVMLTGLDVLPEYRKKGLASYIMKTYVENQKDNGKKTLYLTCLEEKVEMYKKMGFENNGFADSSWGGEAWYEMILSL